MDKLLFHKPAEEWKDALPLGNGSLGAMVFGGISEETVCFNEDTLWSGSPGTAHDPSIRTRLAEVRRLTRAGQNRKAQSLIEENMLGPWNQSYMPMGELSIQFRENRIDTVSDFSYSRSLDLANAIWEMEYRKKDLLQKRESWISYPSRLWSYRIRQIEGAPPELFLGLSSQLPSHIRMEGDMLVLSGQAPSHVVPSYVEHWNPIQYDGSGMYFTLALKVLHNGVCRREPDGRFFLSGATDITLLAAAGTSYEDCQSISRDSCRTEKQVLERLNAVAADDLPGLRAKHIRDYKSLYDRVSLHLVEAADPAHVRPLSELTADPSPGNSRSLSELFFNYGRYLLISSSRPGSQAANLQGIWSYKLRPDWSSNWTVNINTQMNYWPAELTGLEECCEPLYSLIRELSIDGALTAMSNYGCRGWCASSQCGYLEDRRTCRRQCPVGFLAHGGALALPAPLEQIPV